MEKIKILFIHHSTGGNLIREGNLRQLLKNKNPNITLEFIEKHIDESWDFFMLSSNPNVTLDFIEKHNNTNKHKLFSKLEL